MVKIAGPTFSKKKITIQVLDEITEQIQRYLMVQVFTSVLVGVATWLAMSWIGLEHAAVWGVAAAVLNLVPYLGSVVTAGGLALVGFLQFGTLGMAAADRRGIPAHQHPRGQPADSLADRPRQPHEPGGDLRRRARLGLAVGHLGAVLGPPLLMMVKAVCDRIEDLKTIGELLGA